MALNGIPISDEQCIGDSLPIINTAFATLDARIGVSETTIQSIQQQTTTLATVDDLNGYIPKPIANSDDKYKVLTYNSTTATWLPSSLPAALTNVLTKPSVVDADAYKVLTYTGSTSSWVASAVPVSTAVRNADGSLNNTSGIIFQWGSYSFSGSTQASISFSKPFTTIYTVIPSNPNTIRHVSVYSQSTTGAVLSAGGTTTGSGYYVAIGI